MRREQRNDKRRIYVCDIYCVLLISGRSNLFSIEDSGMDGEVMTNEEIKNGDICILDESVEYSYRPKKPYEVLVLWNEGSQPLVTKLEEYRPFWTTYSQLTIVKRHIDLSITALEQQPCEDCISRESAMRLLDEISDGRIKPREAFVSLDFMADRIAELPSVQPKPIECEDCISRAEVINHIYRRLWESALNNVGYECKAEDVFMDVADNRLKTWIDELPSIQPKPIECKDAISREYILSKAHCCCDDLADDEPCCVDADDIREAPSVQPINQNIKALGKELRTFRGGIKDKKVLTGFNMAIALCNKHLADMGGTE